MSASAGRGIGNARCIIGKLCYARATHQGVRRGPSPPPGLSHRGRGNGTPACVRCSRAIPGASQCAPAHSPIGSCRGAETLCVLLSSPFPKGGPRGIGSAHHRDCRTFSSHWRRMARNDICGSGGPGPGKSYGLAAIPSKGQSDPARFLFIGKHPVSLPGRVVSDKLNVNNGSQIQSLGNRAQVAREVGR